MLTKNVSLVTWLLQRMSATRKAKSVPFGSQKLLGSVESFNSRRSC